MYTTIPKEFVMGVTYSNSAGDVTNDILFTDGFLGGKYTLIKQLDAAWAAGNNAGGLDTGAIANALYHCHAIRKDSDGSIDFLFSLSFASPTMPAGYTAHRRVGTIFRASAAIRPFTQFEDEIRFTTIINDVAVSNLSTTQVLFTLSVPTGKAVDAVFQLEETNATAQTRVVLATPTDADEAATVAPSIRNVTSSISTFQGHLRLRTNTSAQIGARSAVASTTLGIYTRGWIETRESL